MVVYFPRPIYCNHVVLKALELYKIDAYIVRLKPLLLNDVPSHISHSKPGLKASTSTKSTMACSDVGETNSDISGVGAS